MMRVRVRWILLAGVMLAGSVLGWAALAAGDTTPRRPPVPVEDPADLTTIAELQDTYRSYWRALYDAEVAQDPVSLTSVLYNDPAVELEPDDRERVEKYRGEVFAVLNRSDGPIGVDSGYLSAEIARFVWRQRGIVVRGAVETRAAVTGRDPHHEVMPDGLGAFVRTPLTSWQEPTFSLSNVRSDGSHASAEVYADVITHIYFTNVDGTWYVSDIWTEKPN